MLKYERPLIFTFDGETAFGGNATCGTGATLQASCGNGGTTMTTCGQGTQTANGCGNGSKAGANLKQCSTGSGPHACAIGSGQAFACTCNSYGIYAT